MASSELTIPTWEAFADEMNAEGRDWVALLPSNISADRFRACAITAVKQNPDLLRCTARSLFNAISRAAQDGMMPDGREGFINSYNSKIGKNDHGRDIYGHVAQWQPMAFGMRKRARELDDIIIDAQVVYQNDHFIWHQGDNPSIEHTPVPLGKDQDRGMKTGAYAIYRKGGAILHREVMDYGQIEKAREKSKAPDSLMWKDFPEEGYRKTVLRRGIKSVPVSESMAEIIKRDDEENYDFSDDKPDPNIAIPPRPRVSEFSRPRQVESKPQPQTLGDVSIRREPEKVEAGQSSTDAGSKPADKTVIDPKPEPQKTAAPEPLGNVAMAAAEREKEREDFIKGAYTLLSATEKVRDIPKVNADMKAPGVMTEDEEAEWDAACDARGKEIMTKAKAAAAKK